MPKKDFYNHLNADDSFVMRQPLPKVVEQLLDMNYGAHRVLSAMIDILNANKRRQNEKYIAEHPNQNPRNLDPRSDMAQALEEVLNKGHVD